MSSFELLRDLKIKNLPVFKENGAVDLLVSFIFIKSWGPESLISCGQNGVISPESSKFKFSPPLIFE